MSQSNTPIDLAARRAARRSDLPETLTPRQLQTRAMNKMRHNLASLADEKYEDAKRWLEMIEITDGPKAAFDAYVKLLDFAVPRLTRAEVAVEDNTGQGVREMGMEELQELVMLGFNAGRAEDRTVEGDYEDVTDAEDYSDLTG